MKEYYIIVAWYLSGPMANKPFVHHILDDWQKVAAVAEYLKDMAQSQVITIQLPV